MDKFGLSGDCYMNFLEMWSQLEFIFHQLVKTTSFSWCI
jgi:hypothetical protein